MDSSTNFDATWLVGENATWNPPIAEACPNCGWPVLTIKTTKRWGVEKVCPQKECGWKEQIEPPAPKGAKTDEA